MPATCLADAAVLARIASANRRERARIGYTVLARVVGPDKSVLGVLRSHPVRHCSTLAILNRSLPSGQHPTGGTSSGASAGMTRRWAFASDQLFMVRARRLLAPAGGHRLLWTSSPPGTTASRAWWKHPWDGYRIRRMTGVSVHPMAGVGQPVRIRLCGAASTRPVPTRDAERRGDATANTSAETERQEQR